MEVGCQPLSGDSMRWLTDTVYGVSNPHDAAARNRVLKINKYVQQGGDVTKKNKLGDTPLHEACAYIDDNGETSKGKRRNSCIQVRRSMGKLGQQERGEGGPLEMLELLVRAGSDINAQNIVGDAPLHKAAVNGRALAADYLIRLGADVNIRNEFARTPLHMACVSGSIEVVQKLVQGGADTSAEDAAQETPFHEACRHRFESIVIYLMRQVENADTSENIGLWRGLDSSWEKNIRKRIQDRVDRAGDRGKHPPTPAPATAPVASASAVPNHDGLGTNTPSTLHDSMQSAESLRGQTPSGSKEFSGSQKAIGSGVMLSNGSPKTKSFSLPTEAMVKITNGPNGHRGLREEQTNAAVAHATAKIGEGSVAAPTNDIADAAGSDDGSQGKKDDGIGGVEVGSVLMTPPREGRSVLRPGMKASPNAAGRATPPSRGVRDVRVSTPTREGVRRTPARKNKNVLVLQSPRPRVSRRSFARLDSANKSVRTGRDEGSKIDLTNGSEGTSRRPVLFLKGESHAHAAGASSRKGVAPMDAENVSGGVDGPDPSEVHHRPRRREDSGVAGGGVGDSIDVDVNVVAGKSSHRQRRHRDRDLDATRLSPARDKPVRRRQHKRHKGVEILRRGSSQQHPEEAGGLRKEKEGTTASSQEGDQQSRGRRRSSWNGSRSGSARDATRREPKSGRSALAGVAAPRDKPSAAKVSVEEAEVIVPRTRIPRAHNDSPGKGVRGQTKAVAREKSGGVRGRSVTCPLGRSGSGQEVVLASPTWASEIGNGLSKMAPFKKKVLESPVPMKRNTPYIPYRISSPSPRPKIDGAAMRAKVSPRKDGFFPLGASHATPRARTPASSRREPENILGAAADSSVSAPIISDKHSRKPSVSDGAGAAWFFGAAPVSKMVFVTDMEDDDPPGIEALHAGLSAADAGAGTGANGVEVIVRGEGGTSIRLTSWAKSSVASSVKRAASANSQGAVVFSDSETDNDRASSVGGQAPAGSTTFGGLRSISTMPTPTHPPIPPSVEATSSFQPCKGTTMSDEDVELTMEKSAENAASSLVFQGSFGAGSASSPGKGSRAVAAAADSAATASVASVTFPSPLNESRVAKILSEYRSGDSAESVPTKEAWDAGVRAATIEAKSTVGVARAEDSLVVDRGESSRSFDSGLTRDSGKLVNDLESETPAAELSAAVPLSFEGRASSVKPSFALIPVPLPVKSDESISVVDTSRSQASAPGAEEETAEETPVEPEAKTILEASAALTSTRSLAALPTEPVKSMPASMITSSSPKLPAASRKVSSLGRSGQPPVKVNMPIVGGRAAWNKFLADAAAEGEGEGTRRIDEIDDSAGSAVNDDARGSVHAENNLDEKEDVDDQDPLDIDERAPRGFKNPAQAEGSNKGPAGAFSGNSMWRLAGGATSATNRARSGLEVNGDGGFSNPLAAMRASSARKRPETSAAEGIAAQGGASLNPLSGLRGAATMNGAGIANPLARGRSLRRGTVGAVNLPLGGIGASTTNSLARKASSAAVAPPMGATTEGDYLEGPGERARPATIMGYRGRLDSVGRINEIASASALSIVQLAEKSLRVYDFALPSSTPSLPFPSASDGLGSSDGAAAEVGGGGRKEPLSSEAASAVQPSGGVGALQRGGFRSNGRPLPLRPRRERTVHENELLHEADRNPGQAKVASVVMAFQKMGNPRSGLVIKDPHQIEVSSVAEQGLVQLRRVNWSPHAVQTNGP